MSNSWNSTEPSRALRVALALACLGAGCGKANPLGDGSRAVEGVDAGIPPNQPVGGDPGRPQVVPPAAFDAGGPLRPDAGGERPDAGTSPGDAATEDATVPTPDGGPLESCTPRLTRCDDMQTPAICDNDGRWQAQAPCSGSTPVCRLGGCVACDSGLARCAGSGALQVCDRFGNWGPDILCVDSEQCIDGRCGCVPDLTPTRCSDQAPATPQYCTQDREYADAQACGGATPVCLVGQCVACEPGPGQCLADGTREYCDASGSPAVETCPADAPCIGGSCRRAVVAASGGFGHTCAILDDASLKCWGAGGVLGLEDERPRGWDLRDMGDALPRVDLGTGRKVLAVATGEAHSCALLDGGEVKCWGANYAGMLGLGDQGDRGHTAGTMGDALPAVDLGTGRSAKAIAVGFTHSCALLDNDQIKCWGDNHAGQLGLGDSAPRGGEPGQMGDALPAVDLGTGRTAKSVAAGAMTCALLDNGQVKCWGENELAILGLGYRGNNRGDQPGEMGDSLPAVDLGTGRAATSLSMRAGHACAELDDGRTKCWGFNMFGQVGIGTAHDVGDEPGEMGDALPALDLGTGLSPLKVATAAFHTCAVLDDATLKCWGAQNVLSLGEPPGDPTVQVGDEPGEMGDALARVDLGTGAVVLDVFTGFAHTCALLDNHQLKCWGQNVENPLGLGIEDDEVIGDRPEEMGDALPLIDLGR